jgi:hypothetical protein
MAKLITRTWTTTGILVGESAAPPTVNEDWTKHEALAELVKRQAEIAAGKVTRPEARTLGQLRGEYLAYKLGKKRTLHEDERMLTTRLLPAFGADLPVRKLAASAIAQYEKQRAGGR